MSSHKLKFLTVLISLLIGSTLFSEEKSKNADEKNANKKIYSEIEFDKKLKEEMSKEVATKVAAELEKVTPKNLLTFSKEILEKEKSLIEKVELLERREKQLEINEVSFQKRIQEVKQSHEKILGCIQSNEKKESDRMLHLVNVVSNMKPVSAAQVLSAQEPDISVKILSHLEAVKAAKIFNLMDKEVSARLQKQYINMKK